MIRETTRLQSLDMTNNHLRNTFAIALGDSMGVNQSMIRIKLEGNSIDLKHIRCIEKLLQTNRTRGRHELIPVYREEEKKYATSARDYTRAEDEIVRLGREYETVKKVVGRDEVAMKIVEQHQLAASMDVKSSKLGVDEALENVENKILDLEVVRTRVTSEGENRLRLLGRKLQESSRISGKISSEIDGIRQTIQTRTEAHNKQIESLRKRLEDERAELYPCQRHNDNREHKMLTQKAKLEELRRARMEVTEEGSGRHCTCTHGKTGTKKSGCGKHAIHAETSFSSFRSGNCSPKKKAA